MIRYKITWKMVSPTYVEGWKQTLKRLGSKEVIDSLYTWYETTYESEDFKQIHDQLVGLLTMESEGKEPVKDVKFFKATIEWEEIKQEDLVKI